MSEQTAASRQRLKERFTAAFEKVGGKVSTAKNNAEISQRILQICALENASKMILWNHPGLTALSPMLSMDTRFQVNWNHDELNKTELLKAMENVEIGITWTDYAVAETGSLVLLSSPGRSRSVSLLPDVHIAILPMDKLYDTRVEVFKLLTPQMKLHRSVTLISGPSKTGDIDGKLNVGVHGPKKVFVILLEEASE
jgi:L-lactate dehydrogenase complex protein LldG